MASVDTVEQGSDADVFVEVRPVNAFTIAEQQKPRACLGACRNQAGKPGERHEEAAAVGEPFVPVCASL